MRINLILASSILAAGTLAAAEETPKKKTVQNPHSPSVTTVYHEKQSEKRFRYEQKPITVQSVLVPPEQAHDIVARFREAYPKLGSPRIVIYVNRELVDQESGYQLTDRTQRKWTTRSEVKRDFQADPNAPDAPTEDNRKTRVNAGGDVIINQESGRPAPGTEESSGQIERTYESSRYEHQDRPPRKLADRQTVRDVERLFGRPLRAGGAILADQRVATEMMGDKPLTDFTRPPTNEQARKDRKALKQIADVVLEILISSREVVVQEVSGDKVYPAPDIQATAIRIEDARIMGQAAASDILGKDQYAGPILRQFDVRDIAEATALALMEDMMIGLDQSATESFTPDPGPTPPSPTGPPQEQENANP